MAPWAGCGGDHYGRGRPLSPVPPLPQGAPSASATLWASSPRLPASSNSHPPGGPPSWCTDQNVRPRLLGSEEKTWGWIRELSHLKQEKHPQDRKVPLAGGPWWLPHSLPCTLISAVWNASVVLKDHSQTIDRFS